jgi:hypothetical protein
MRRGEYAPNMIQIWRIQLKRSCSIHFGSVSGSTLNMHKEEGRRVVCAVQSQKGGSTAWINSGKEDAKIVAEEGM